MNEFEDLHYRKHIYKATQKTLTFDEVGKAVSATLNVITEADLKRAENGEISAKVFNDNLHANYQIFRMFLHTVSNFIQFRKEKAIDEYMELLAGVAIQDFEDRIMKFRKDDL